MKFSLRHAMLAATLGCGPGMALSVQEAGQSSAPVPATATQPAGVPVGQVVPPGVVVPPAPPSPEQILAGIAADAAAGGLVITDLKVGKGEPALPGMMVAVHYTGWLHDPTRPDGKAKSFDSSRDRRQAFVFPLGQRRVIRGWDLGVAGMKPGGQRRLVIPAPLAYGERGAGGVIPPGATLVFDIELLGLDAVR